MSLLNAFLEIEIPQTENSKLFNATALSDFPFAKIGVNYLGFPFSSKIGLPLTSVRFNL